MQIRLTEAQQQKTEEKDMKSEQLEKVAKLESWRKELKVLEDKKAELEAWHHEFNFRLKKLVV